jgi:hypothetical protein
VGSDLDQAGVGRELALASPFLDRYVGGIAVLVSVVMAVAVASSAGTRDQSEERGCADGGQIQLHLKCKCDCYTGPRNAIDAFSRCRDRQMPNERLWSVKTGNE